MSYFPKSKLKISHTSGGEFIFASSGKPYNGPYIEFSNGTFFAGKNPRRLGEKITKPLPLEDNFGKTKQTKKHIILKGEIYERLKKTKPIPTLKTLPTEKDYLKGNYPRYFIKRVNQPFGYKEVSKKIHLAIKSQDPEYDYNMYITGYINWDLTNNPAKVNKSVLEKTEEFYPNISILFPILTEFQRLIKTEQYTEGNEYYLEDGTKYVGFYHVHPIKGAMVGPFHTQDPHELLFRFNQLSLNIRIKLRPESDPTLKFRDDYGGKEAERIDEGRGSTGRPSGRPSGGGGSSGGGTSGGGGGGY